MPSFSAETRHEWSVDRIIRDCNSHALKNFFKKAFNAQRVELLQDERALVSWLLCRFEEIELKETCGTKETLNRIEAERNTPEFKLKQTQQRRYLLQKKLQQVQKMR